MTTRARAMTTRVDARVAMRVVTRDGARMTRRNARGGCGGGARGRGDARARTTTRALEGDADANARRMRRRSGREGEARDGGEGDGRGNDDARLAADRARWMEILKEESSRDPEIAALLEGANEDPKIVEDKIRERFERKREKIYQERSGSTVPTLVTFREVNAFSCWIWVESHNPIAEMEKPLLEEVFKAWFVLGKLGGFNSYNMQAMENYDEPSHMDYSMERAHEFSTDTSSHVFHEMSEMEFRGRWARVWIDMGTADEMAFDVLINSLIQFSREYFGLKQVIIGGVNEDWTTEGSEFGNTDLMIDETFGRGPRGRLGSSR